jgi:hypothetical protein
VFWVVRPVVHELAHGVANGLLGGTFGFSGTRELMVTYFGYTFNSCFYNYCLHGFYGGAEPMMSIRWEETGTLLPDPWNYALALLAGPLSIIVLFWVYAYFNNPVDLPCGRNVVWKWKRGWAWGFMILAWFEVAYLVTDPFPGGWTGDGFTLMDTFAEQGLTPLGVNLEYFIAIALGVVTAYFTLLTMGNNPRNALRNVYIAFNPWRSAA